MVNPFAAVVVTTTVPFAASIQHTQVIGIFGLFVGVHPHHHPPNDHVPVGAVSSITSIGEATFVLVFPLGSVTVITLSTHVPSSNHPVPLAVQFTVPLAVAGSGAQVIHGTVTLAHASILLRASVTVCHVCAGFGLKLITVGSIGSVVSIVGSSLQSKSIPRGLASDPSSATSLSVSGSKNPVQL